MSDAQPTAEHRRLAEAPGTDDPWRLWGPYVAGRQWGTVREDYSPDGEARDHFPFDRAHTRAYRWGEDGIAGLTDRYGFLTLATAMWNGHDDRLKERLFGLSGPQGNHGEDAKEYWWHLDATPDALLRRVPLPLSPGGLPLRGPRRAQRRARARGRRVRAERYRCARAGPLLRRRHPARQGGRARRRHRDRGHQPRSRPRAPRPAPTGVVPQHVVPGPR
uniref:Uncharacterized protein n=1 Tax=Janibacter limosus TaxID=53458 RepID=A0AC61U176_9MICO|nr:hypothetical protein [Janibacter limosus]